MFENVLGFTMFLLVSLAGIGGYFIFARIRERMSVRSAAVRVHSLTHCPNCSADITEELKARAAKAFSGTARYTCSCGSSSSWDVFGDPPALITFERVQQKKREISRRG
jgi:drug/metabolite transporter superfamily protein YnfA